MTQLRTPITYYGGKTKMLPWIMPMIPEHDEYTEVFAGGLTVFFAKKPARIETINDTNGLVINFWETVKLKFHCLKPLIDATLHSREQHSRAWRILCNPEEYSNVEKAWAFWMCSNFSYANKLGGALKYGSDSENNMPRTVKNQRNNFTEEIMSRIEGTTIENRDAVHVFSSKNNSNTFHFIDPPYMEADQGHYNGYTEDDFEELLTQMVSCKGKFMLTNYHSPILKRFADENDWYIESKEYSSGMSANRGNSKVEVVVTNYHPNFNKSLELFPKHAH